MVFEGKNLNNLVFERRLEYFDKLKNLPNIKIKKFIKLNETYKSQIENFKKEKKEYEIDGIILNPKDGLYDNMIVYKYKPADKLTIDFLIKSCPKVLQKKISESININTKQNIYLLFSGMSKKMFRKLNMKLIDFYSEIFPHLDSNNLPNYFPIQFEPSSKKLAYIYTSDDANLDNEVGEFLYHSDRKEWELKKIRTDRKIEVARGNYFGNNYKIAEFIWMSYNDPLIIEKEEDGDQYIRENNILQKSANKYINFVKEEIYKQYKNIKWIMDLGCGKGDDLFIYNINSMKNIIFLDINKTNLFELIRKKYLFATNDEYYNPMSILIQNLDLTDSYKINIEKINNVYNSSNINLIVSNFSLQYFIKDNKSLENICKLINYYLKNHGAFIFTAFDEKKIINLLKDKKEWIINENDEIKYCIKKKYLDDNLLFGKEIDVLSPFNNNIFDKNYLINIHTIETELKKYNIQLEKNESFSHYLDKYSDYLDANDKQYIDLYHYYVFIKN
jgi:hypothetical protein